MLNKRPQAKSTVRGEVRVRNGDLGWGPSAGAPRGVGLKVGSKHGFLCFEKQLTKVVENK
jgi:hypothetical protein